MMWSLAKVGHGYRTTLIKQDALFTDPYRNLFDGPKVVRTN